ncbi:MAG: Flp family type IVb pilin [Pseudomonadota bacterium]
MSKSGCVSDSQSLIGRFVQDESGSTAIEYGLIVALIFLAILAGVNNFTDANKDIYSSIQSALEI